MREQSPPMILLPGLNGDERVFEPQAEMFDSARVASWIKPLTGESMREYARRLAHRIDPGQECIVVGVSFGGIVAMELSRHVKALACVVIASTRDVKGLPRAVRMMRPMAAAMPVAILGHAVRGGWTSAATTLPRVKRRVRRMSCEQLKFRQWAITALLRWKPAAESPCPVIQIHGDRDATFPAGRRDAEFVVHGAGHLLTLTHAAQVNAHLAEVMAQYGA